MSIKNPFKTPNNVFGILIFFSCNNVGGIFGGPLKKKPGMQISIISFDGECVLAVAVQCTDEDVAVLQKTLDDMVSEITAYAAK